MTQLNLRRTATALALALVMPACDFGTSCTLIGCANSGFTFGWQAPDTLPDGTYTVTVTASAFVGDGRQTTAACDVELNDGVASRAGGACSGFDGTFTFSDFFPTEALVVVSDADGTLVENSVSTTYTSNRPNGPDCGPVCRTAPAFMIAL